MDIKIPWFRSSELNQPERQTLQPLTDVAEQFKNNFRNLALFCTYVYQFQDLSNRDIDSQCVQTCLD